MFFMTVVVGLLLLLLLDRYFSIFLSSSVIDTSQKFVQTVPLPKGTTPDTLAPRFQDGDLRSQGKVRDCEQPRCVLACENHPLCYSDILLGN